MLGLVILAAGVLVALLEIAKLVRDRIDQRRSLRTIASCRPASRTSHGAAE